MADLKLIGAVAVKVRPDAKGFRGETKKQVLKELAGQEYDVVVNLDLDAAGVKEKAKRIVREVKREAEESIGIRVGVDPDALRKASGDIKKVLGDFKMGDVKVEMDKEYLRKAGRQINDALNAASAAGLKVDVSTQEGLEQAKRDIDRFLQEENGRPVKFKADLAGLDIAAAQLKYATRDRRVNFFVNVNKKSLLVAEGLIRSLSGLGVLTSVGQRLESLIVNFDKFSLKSAGWATAIAGLANTLTYMATSAFTIGEGVVQSVGLLALLPTALAAVAAGVLINVAAFKNFKSAIDGDAEALAALPPQARAAADALRGTWTAIQRPVQAAFWEGMGDSIQRFAANTIPVLRDGLTAAADDVGRFNAGILDSFEEIAKNGDLAKMFGNLEGFFRQSTAASKPFFDALNILGLRGSDYLPRFGGFLTDISQGFRDWAKEADEAGRINVWIEKGVQSLKDMGSVGGSVIDMFKGITRAVNDAGGGGLPEFRKNMRGIADIMTGEPFRSRMATIFAGARKGASELNVGIKDLGRTIGESAGYTRDLLIGLGGLGGGVLSGLAKTVGQLQFQTGTLEGIRDMRSALTDLGPSFEGLGRIIGNMSRVSGEIFKGVAPVINTVVGFLDKSVGKLTGNLEKVAGPLTGLVNALVTAATGPLTMVVEVLDATLGFFNDLPAPVQLAAAAFGTFILLRGPLGSFLTMAQSSLGKLSGAFTGAASVAALGGKRIGDMVYYADGSVRRFDARPMVKQLDTIGAKALSVGRSVGGGLMALAGGPWGLALAGAGVAIALMGDAAAKQKAKIDDLRTSLDGQQGINAATEKVIASQLRAKESFLWMEQDSVAENAQNIGIRLRDLQKAAEGVPEAIDSVTASLKRASEARNPFEKSMDFLKMLGDGRLLAGVSGFSSFLGDMFGSDAQKTGAGLQKLRDDLKAVGLETAETAKQLGYPVNTSAGIISAIDTLVNKASDADQKLRAINDIIRIMDGADSTAADAAQRANDSSRNLHENLKAIFETATKDGAALPDLFNETTGQIDTVSKAGSDLRTELKRVAEDGRTSAIALALAQKDPQKAAEILHAEMTKIRELIAKELEIGKVPPEEIEAIIASLKLNPAKIDMLLNPESRDQALRDFGVANGLIQAEAKPIGLDLDASTMNTKLGAATYEIGEFSNLKPTPKLDADKTPFDGIVAQAKGTGEGLAGTTFTPGVNADKGLFDTAISSVRGAGETLAGETFSPTVNVIGNAMSNVASIIDSLNSIGGKVFEATVNILGKVFGGESADGSIYKGAGKWDSRFQPKYFANGGVENHVAQIAKPSSMVRVWAEPETGGEAYIPLASSKRARSTAILDEVARKFGYELTKAEHFGNGGVVGGEGVGGGVHYHSHIDAAPGVNYLYAQDIARAAEVRARDMQALYAVA